MSDHRHASSTDTCVCVGCRGLQSCVLHSMMGTITDYSQHGHLWYMQDYWLLAVVIEMYVIR